MLNAFLPFSPFQPFRAQIGQADTAPNIGIAGAAGFGVGVSQSNPSALGLLPLPGYDDPLHANYGNYQHVNGSIVCFVPRCWIRIGSSDSPRYAIYGLNAIDVLPASAFRTEAAAIAAGYFLHRAYIDGGNVQDGFFIDKYLLSKDGGGTTAISVPNGVPISMTTDTAYTRSQGMPGCSGILADAITLSRARGTGWQCQSIWQNNVLGLLSLAHGQAATSSDNCAWYDPTGTTNFPKGCNNNALKDTNDVSVTYTTAGDSGAAAKPKTGSANNLAKTAHNGQACGVADLNGALWEPLVGLTAPGTSATDATQRTDGTVWTLRPEIAIASLTGGWNGSTDAFQLAVNIAALYEQQVDLLQWGAATDWQRFGNGVTQVFAHGASGADWLRTCSGIAAASGMSASGANLIGLDGCYRYSRANVFPLAGGAWNSGSNAGVFARFWGNYRTNAHNGVGGRAAAYPI